MGLRRDRTTTKENLLSLDPIRLVVLFLDIVLYVSAPVVSR